MIETCRGRIRILPALATALALAACGMSLPGTGGNTTLALADRALASGDYETSATLYRQAYDSNPRSTDALVGLGQSYAGMGQYSRAEQALLEAKGRRGNDPEILLQLARIQLLEGNTTAALENLDVAQNRRPNDLQIATARGVALDRLSRHQEAQEVYRRGLSRDPTNYALLGNLGLSLGLSGQFDESIKILRELQRDAKANSTSRGNLALVYGLSGREREARATLQQDLSSSQIEANIVYYRQLRQLLNAGQPIGDRT